MRRTSVKSTFLAALLGFFAVSANAASFDDPDWPCIQRKVLKLSIGQMWAGPAIDEAIEALADTDMVRSAALRIALRRTSIEEAEGLIEDFAKREDTDDAHLAALFLAVFNQITRERTQVMNGIARYANKQTSLSNQIEERRAAIVAIEEAEKPDWDKFDELSNALIWDERIYRDRTQSLTYVCETPVLLEQRAFSLARSVMGHLE
jgi:hypothetical protein